MKNQKAQSLRDYLAQNHEFNKSEMARSMGCTHTSIGLAMRDGAVIHGGRIYTECDKRFRVFNGKIYKGTTLSLKS